MAGRSAGELLDNSLVGAGLLGATANVIMQLARPPVGHAVVDSTVDSGKLFLHPVKRTRTTITYIAVATAGTDEERRLYRQAVNSSHGPVRSTPSSATRYSAFDPELQLWVAACLYRGCEDTYRVFVGELDEEDAETLYRAAARFGTTLQVPPALWPVDRAAFERYWDEALSEVFIGEEVREYLNEMVRLKFLPRLLSALFGPINRFITTGYLRPVFREAMGLRWGDRQQRLFDRLISVTAFLVGLAPRFLRRLPYNALLWDLRRRIRTGRPLV